MNADKCQLSQDFSKQDQEDVRKEQFTGAVQLSKLFHYYAYTGDCTMVVLYNTRAVSLERVVAHPGELYFKCINQRSHRS